MMAEDIPTCRIHGKYIDIECANPAIPGDPQGCCILHSQDKGKDTVAFRQAVLAIWAKEDSESHDFRLVFFPDQFEPDDFFNSSEFEKPIDFYEATFAEEADFSKAAFKERADFSFSTFKKAAIFEATTFFKVADFSGGIFEDEVDFSDAIFADWADFGHVTFNERANFCWATFEETDFVEAIFIKEAEFFGTIFTKAADFSGTTFSEQADFSGARIETRVVFQSLNPPGEGDHQFFQGDFCGLKFSPVSTLHFQDLSLAQVEFQGTDLRTVEFHHVQWHPYRGRQAIYDEVLLGRRELSLDKRLAGPNGMVTFSLELGPKINEFIAEALLPLDPPNGNEYGEVERLYRNLKLNYEGAGDFKNAGDFHYGEMEMHRRASKWRWFPFYWYNLYWALSGYGERPSRALVWLIGFIIALAGFAWGLGLEMAQPQQMAERMLPHFHEGKRLGLNIYNSIHLAGFGDSLIYILQKATLQRPDWAKPATFLGQLVSSLSVLLIPGQAALFLLALRNRLGRRR